MVANGNCGNVVVGFGVAIFHWFSQDRLPCECIRVYASEHVEPLVCNGLNTKDISPSVLPMNNYLKLEEKEK